MRPFSPILNRYGSISVTSLWHRFWIRLLGNRYINLEFCRRDTIRSLMDTFRNQGIFNFVVKVQGTTFCDILFLFWLNNDYRWAVHVSLSVRKEYNWMDCCNFSYLLVHRRDTRWCDSYQVSGECDRKKGQTRKYLLSKVEAQVDDMLGHVCLDQEFRV